MLRGYGPGGVTGVSAHGERALEFGGSFGLPVTEVPVDDPGGDAIDPDPINTAIGWLEHTGHGSRRRTYRLRDWLFSRQRYWGEPFPVVYDSHGLPVALPDEVLPVTLPEMTDFAAPPGKGDGEAGGRGAHPGTAPARRGGGRAVELSRGGTRT